jgi:hypothetical protein
MEKEVRVRTVGDLLHALKNIDPRLPLAVGCGSWHCVVDFYLRWRPAYTNEHNYNHPEALALRGDSYSAKQFINAYTSDPFANHPDAREHRG